MSQNGWAQTATPPAWWIRSIASATVGLLRGTYGLGARDEVLGEEIPGAADAGSRQALLVVGIAENRFREMWTAKRPASPSACLELAVVEDKPGAAEPLGHREHAVLPIQPELDKCVGKCVSMVIDAVTEHVELLTGAIDRRKLYRGHDCHAVLGAGSERVIDPVNGVVISQSQQLDACGSCRADGFAGSQLPV